MDMRTDLLSVNEAAEVAGVTVGRIRQLLLAQTIEGYHLNRRAWVVSKKSLEKWAREIPATGRPRNGKKKK